MADNDNPLALMTVTELHEDGLGYLHRARQEYEKAPSAAGAASIGIAHFFASMSADNLAASAGAHRDITPPHGTPPVRPSEHAGHHG